MNAGNLRGQLCSKRQPSKAENITQESTKSNPITTRQAEERNEQMNTQETLQHDGVCRTVSGQPLSQHYVFDNIREHRRLLALGSGALKGIGAMMEVGLIVANEQVSAKRDDLADIFTFFGEVMAGHVESIEGALDLLQDVADGREV